jgi:hypothetical protein
MYLEHRNADGISRSLSLHAARPPNAIPQDDRLEQDCLEIPVVSNAKCFVVERMARPTFTKHLPTSRQLYGHVMQRLAVLNQS